MKWQFLPFVLSGLIGLVPPTQAAEQPCKAYTIDRPGANRGYDFEEINNCPILNGTFANANFRVEMTAWEPGAYRYKGTNVRNHQSIELIDFDVAGTTHRPKYIFHNGQTKYVVTFRPTQPNLIRLEVFQGTHPFINELLYR